MDSDSGYEVVKEAAREYIVQENGTKFLARCPAHDDNRASLSVGKGDDGRALVHCFAGCSIQKVVEALGLTMASLFGAREEWDAAQYVYTDEDGQPLIRVTRTYPKGFRQERYEDGMWKNRLLGTRRTLYNLPEILKAPTVYIVEGEKDVESLRQEGVTATTVMGGAGRWREEYAPSLRGKTVVIVADNDQPGLEGALRIQNGLRGVATVTGVWHAPDGCKDITDMLNKGLGLGDLVKYEPDMAQFEPMDWDSWETPEEHWLMEPYVPANARVMLFGPAGSLKSLWAMWVGSRLADEGHKVAYFSLEMPPKEVARRMKKLNPPSGNFKLLRKLSFDSQGDLSAACDLLQGYSLIIVDSWSAVHGDTNNNDAVARLDREFFLPLIEQTGASLLILDNTGQGVLTDKGKLQPDWARGASAKGDKMDVTLMFDRPDESDNHLCRIQVKKMRMPITLPKPALIRTAQDEIDFHFVDSHGADLGSMWQGAPPPPKEEKPEAPASILDRLRVARAESRLQEETP